MSRRLKEAIPLWGVVIFGFLAIAMSLATLLEAPPPAPEPTPEEVATTESIEERGYTGDLASAFTPAIAPARAEREACLESIKEKPPCEPGEVCVYCNTTRSTIDGPLRWEGQGSIATTGSVTRTVRLTEMDVDSEVIIEDGCRLVDYAGGADSITYRVTCEARR